MVGPYGGPSVINFQLSSGDLGIPTPGVLTAPSSFNRLPPTILEGNDEEEVDDFDGLDMTRTNTATYMLPIQMQQNSYEEDGTGTGAEYSHSSLLQHNKNSQRQLIDVIVNRNHNPTNTMIVNEDEQKKSQTVTPKAKPALSPLSPALLQDGIIPTPMEETQTNENQYRLKKIPREDEMIDGVEESAQSSFVNGGSKSTGTGIITSTTMAALQRMYDDITEQSDVDTINSDQLSPRRNPKIEKFVPSMINTSIPKHTSSGSQDTDLQQHLTPIHTKPAIDITKLNPRSYTTEAESPLTDTPEPDTVTLPEVPSTLPPHSSHQHAINSSDGNITDNNAAVKTKNRDQLPLPLSAMSSADSDDVGMEYLDYDSKHDDIAITPNKTPMTVSASMTSQRTEKKTVRFATTCSKDDKGKDKQSRMSQLQYIEHDTPNGSPKHKAMVPSKKKKMTMHDLLGGHAGINVGAHKAIKTSDNEESVASKAEPSWFRNW